MFLLLSSLLLAFIGACFEALGRGVQPYVPPAGTVFSAVEGSWDWADRAESCRVNPHTIRFTDDQAYMVLTYPQPIDSATGEREVWYEMRGEVPGGVRGFIVGEERRTSAGAPVVWDLVLTGPNEYRWHRTDWRADGYTAPLVRCPDVAAAPPVPAESTFVPVRADLTTR